MSYWIGMKGMYNYSKLYKCFVNVQRSSPADSRVKFAKWSIVYFNAVLDCTVYLKIYNSTCWTGVSFGNFAIATKV